MPKTSFGFPVISNCIFVVSCVLLGAPLEVFVFKNQAASRRSAELDKDKEALLDCLFEG
jgi:hypothetical protein